MSRILGSHTQSTTRRCFSYWVTCEAVNDAEVCFACAISEPSKGAFGSLERGSTFEGAVPIGPDCAPVDLAIRSRVLSYIERTDFGEWRPPPPNWIGWRGPV